VTLTSCSPTPDMGLKGHRGTTVNPLISHLFARLPSTGDPLSIAQYGRHGRNLLNFRISHGSPTSPGMQNVIDALEHFRHTRVKQIMRI